MTNLVCFRHSASDTRKWATACTSCAQVLAANGETVTDSRKSPEYSYQPEPDIPLNERIDRIKSSINRVNQLMAELRMMTPSADK